MEEFKETITISGIDVQLVAKRLENIQRNFTTTAAQFGRMLINLESLSRTVKTIKRSEKMALKETLFEETIAAKEKYLSAVENGEDTSQVKVLHNRFCSLFTVLEKSGIEQEYYDYCEAKKK